MAVIRIPSQLRIHTESHEKIEYSGAVLQDILVKLLKQYPALKPYLLDERGEIVSFVTVYLNGQDIRFLNHQQTPINERDIISIVPAIAGG